MEEPERAYRGYVALDDVSLQPMADGSADACHGKSHTCPASSPVSRRFMSASTRKSRFAAHKEQQMLHKQTDRQIWTPLIISNHANAIPRMQHKYRPCVYSQVFGERESERSGK